MGKSHHRGPFAEPNISRWWEVEAWNQLFNIFKRMGVGTRQNTGIYMLRGVCGWHGTAFENLFSPFPMWAQEIKHRLTGLEAARKPSCQLLHFFLRYERALEVHI